MAVAAVDATVALREAGGMVSDTLGGENFLDSGDVAAGSPRVHQEMLPHLRPAALKARSARAAPAHSGA